MSFKNLIKKIALVAGSVALLATAGGAISANASSVTEDVFDRKTPEDRTMANNLEKHGHYYGKDLQGKNVNGKAFGNGSEEANAEYTQNGKTYKFNDQGHLLSVTDNNSSANNSASNKANSSASDEANSNANDSASEDDSGNANDYQAGNTNNGKLVQTGENNGAEYAAVAGAILTVSAVAFAGYDLSKNN